MVYLYDANTLMYLTELASDVAVTEYVKIHPNLNFKTTTVELTSEPKKCYKFDETNQVWILDDVAYKTYMQTSLLDRIQLVSDKITDEAPYLLMPGVSRSQVDRYKYKYERAKANDTEFFESEALITGISVNDLINIVIQNGEPIENEYNNLISKIEGFRRGCKLLTYGEKYVEAKRGVYFIKGLRDDINLTNKAFLDYCAGTVSTIGEENPNSNLTSVIDIIGYVPEEPN